MTNDTGYQLELDLYQGPFDLLLKAIDDGQIAVEKINLTQIISGFFRYWREQSPNLVYASDFLYLAACLLEMKSKALLPAKEEFFIEEDLAAVEGSLIAHLQEYQVFKTMAKTLKERKEVFEKIYGRHEGEAEEKEIELVDLSLKDLVFAFKRVYDEAAKRERVVAIKAEEITLEVRLAEVRQMLAERREGIPFEDLFIRRTRVEIVVTFLAMLELAKQSEIRIVQNNRFHSIMILPRIKEQ